MISKEDREKFEKLIERPLDDRNKKEREIDNRFLKKRKFTYKDVCELRGKILNDVIEIENGILYWIRTLILKNREEKNVELLDDFESLLMQLSAFEKRKILKIVSNYFNVKFPDKKIERFFSIRNILAHSSMVLGLKGRNEELLPGVFITKNYLQVKINKELFKEFFDLREEIYEFLNELTIEYYKEKGYLK